MNAIYEAVKRLLLWPLNLYYSLNKKAYRIKKWESEGKKGPAPHIIKERTVLNFKKQYNTSIFIETGTFKGEMVEAMKKQFKTLYSIELDDRLFNNAVKKFKPYPHIKILNGDSGDVLAILLKELNDSCLFWLDGHYSEGVTAKGELFTPIRKELSAIADNYRKFNKDHVILIDDARLFNGENDYPQLEEVVNICKDLFPDYTFEVSNDMIMIHK